MKAFKARKASIMLIFIFTALLAIALLTLSVWTPGKRAIESDSFDPMPNGTYIGNPFVAGGSPLNPQDFPVDIMVCPDDSKAPNSDVESEINSGFDSGVDNLSETSLDKTIESDKTMYSHEPIESEIQGSDTAVDHAN